MALEWKARYQRGDTTGNMYGAHGGGIYTCADQRIDDCHEIRERTQSQTANPSYIILYSAICQNMFLGNSKTTLGIVTCILGYYQLLTLEINCVVACLLQRSKPHESVILSETISDYARKTHRYIMMIVA